MCGITGIISFEQDDHGYIKQMTDLLRHRGPDNDGFYHKENISLGHRRLSIIDLSSNGSQPMSNEEKNIFIVCNGEIYNYKELTKLLIEKGHIFKSKSDTEVLLHLYEEYGDRILDKVNGMFAFAIWDARRKLLIAAVDRFGKKPFYYSLENNKLVFASELKSILILPWIKKTIDYNALDRYFGFRYVPAPQTIFTSVKKLEPADMMIWNDGQTIIKKYWKPAVKEPIKYDEKNIENFHELLKDSVNIRLNSDVPLGIYLSGGVDSSTIAGIMKDSSGKNKISYTVGFDNEFSEQDKANRIADYLGFEFNPIKVVSEDFDRLPEIAYHLDEPFGDMIVLPSYNLARKAKSQLTVVLTGDGADEILLGYFHQKIMAKWCKLKNIFSVPYIPSLASRIATMTPLKILNSFFDYPDRLGIRERNKISYAMKDIENFGTFYDTFISWFTRYDKDILYTEGFKNQITNEKFSNEIEKQISEYRNEGFSFLSQLSLLDLKYWLPFILLFRLDKLNMANAVETRSPFLDYRIVEFALNLEDAAKLNPSGSKFILRNINKRIFPENLYEKGKQAFYMPFLKMYSEKFHNWCEKMLDRREIIKEGLFEWKYIEGLLKDSKTGSMLASRQLVSLSMFQQWRKVFDC